MSKRSRSDDGDGSPSSRPSRKKRSDSYTDAVDPHRESLSRSFPSSSLRSSDVILSNHTCSCNRANVSLAVLDGTVSPCASYFHGIGGLREARALWRRSDGEKLVYSVTLLASPGNVDIAEPVARRERRDGSDAAALPGAVEDIRTMDAWLRMTFSPYECRRFDRRAQRNFSRREAFNIIQSFFNQPGATDVGVFVLYFAGHGVTDRGDWIFGDGVVTFNDVRSAWIRAREKDQLLINIADCCHAGQWIEDARVAHVRASDNQRSMCSIGIIAACQPTEKATETKEGGDFTSRFFAGPQ